jgi:hypothetical protein
LFVDAEPEGRKEKTKKNQEGVSNLDFLPTLPPPFKPPHPIHAASSSLMKNDILCA